jgi:predicted secreted protein
MLKKLAFLLFTVSMNLYAGDYSQFLNLGFSEDGKFFMFGLYGSEGASPRFYAELYTVDMDKNAFVPGSARKIQITEKDRNSEQGLGALLTLLLDNAALVKKQQIRHTLSGRNLYLSLNGDAAEEIKFRDFEAGEGYSLKLIQENADPAGSSFYIRLGRTGADGRVLNYIAGNPQIKRKNVSAYSIREVILAPGGRHLLIVVQKASKGPGGTDISFMVEALKLKS